MNVAGLKLPEHAAPYVALGAVVIGGALVIYYVGKRELAKGAAVAGAAVNPVSADNIFYRGTQEVGRVLTGKQPGEPFSLGGWWWEVTHPKAVAAERAIARPIERPVDIDAELTSY